MKKDPDIELPLLLEAIYQKYHYDFRRYAPSSLKRRLAQAAERFQCRTLSALQDRVLHEPAVFHDLLQYYRMDRLLEKYSQFL